MTDHPSNAEKMRNLTDDHLARILVVLARQQEDDPTAQRERTIRMYRGEMTRRRLERCEHDLARHDGNDAA